MQAFLSAGDGPKKPGKSKYDTESELGWIKKNYPEQAYKDILEAANMTGVSPAMLGASIHGEGFSNVVRGKGVSQNVSQAYSTGLSVEDQQRYPQDGFHDYGLDTFGTLYPKLKQYLPAGFEKEFKVFEGVNEKGEKINSAAFTTPKSAILAKAAFMKYLEEKTLVAADEIGVKINSKDLPYFTMAAYNGGEGNMRTMLSEYKKAPEGFVEKGATSRKGVHVNIKKRVDLMPYFSERFATPQGLGNK